MNKKRTKKATAKKPVMCLRQIDSSTAVMSSNPAFREVGETVAEKLKRGFVRVDASTIVKV